MTFYERITAGARAIFALIVIWGLFQANLFC
jgi:hypothetical protein